MNNANETKQELLRKMVSTTQYKMEAMLFAKILLYDAHDYAAKSVGNECELLFELFVRCQTDLIAQLRELGDTDDHSSLEKLVEMNKRHNAGNVDESFIDGQLDEIHCMFDEFYDDRHSDSENTTQPHDSP